MGTKHDVNGKESSKRKHAVRFLTAALIMSVTYFSLLVIAWFFDKPLFEFPLQLVTLVASVGTALLGVTVFEKPKDPEPTMYPDDGIVHSEAQDYE